MGTFLAAHCDCGYTQPVLAFGEGMAGFTEHCRVPARCDPCREVVLVDYLDANAPSFPCRACGEQLVLYAEFRPGRSSDATGPTKGMTWAVPGGHLVLPTSGNRCPRCGESTLSFKPTGMFD